MGKKFKSVLAVYAILLLVFNFLFFLIPFAKNGAVWVMYPFTLVSLFLGCGITCYAFKSGASLRSKVYGYPVFRIGYVYTLAQLICCVIICAINAYKAVPLWLSAVICILILAAALIGVILTDNTRDTIEKIDKETAVKTRQMTYFKLDIASLADVCTDSEVKKRLSVLAEKLKYSDPVSCDELTEIEGEISNGVDELTQMINADSSDKVIDKINVLINMLADRNRRCKALKK